jgi:hypothetical protein
MPTIASSGGHNVAVRPHRRARRTTIIAALLAPALLLSGCGGESKDKPSAKPSTDLPKGNVAVPAGITLTKAGTALKFGEPALVAYEPNTRRSSVLSLTVNSVTRGRVSDFGGYQLNTRAKRSTPYYARFSVKNIGTGDLSRMAVPLFAVSNSNSLVQPSSFNNTFRACPSTPLPAGFGAGKSYRGCLVYMVPNKGTLVEMSYRPLQAFEPITWKGTIEPPVDKKAAAKKKAAARKAAARKKAAAEKKANS